MKLLLLVFLILLSLLFWIIIGNRQCDDTIYVVWVRQLWAKSLAMNNNRVRSFGDSDQSVRGRVLSRRSSGLIEVFWRVTYSVNLNETDDLEHSTLLLVKLTFLSSWFCWVTVFAFCSSQIEEESFFPPLPITFTVIAVGLLHNIFRQLWIHCGNWNSISQYVLLTALRLRMLMK